MEEEEEEEEWNGGRVSPPQVYGNNIYEFNLFGHHYQEHTLFITSSPEKLTNKIKSSSNQCNSFRICLDGYRASKAVS